MGDEDEKSKRRKKELTTSLIKSFFLDKTMKNNGLLRFLLSGLFLFAPFKKIYGVYRLPLDGITKKFQDYKKGTRLKEREVFFRGTPYKILEYDVDGDRKGDVVEFYELLKYDRIEKIYSTIPCMYGYDLNGDNQYSDDELLIDDYEDGLNNNEYWMDGGRGFV